MNTDLLAELLSCDNHLARAAATRQLRYWSEELPSGENALKTSASDSSALVRMEAVIAASYVGTPTTDALEAARKVVERPASTHLDYAIATSLGSENLTRHWKGEEGRYPDIEAFLNEFELKSKRNDGKSKRGASEASFDSQKGLVKVDISCVPERMMYTVTEFKVKAGAPVRLTLENPTATPHNLVIVKPGRGRGNRNGGKCHGG